MIVVLCHTSDRSAQWAGERLRARSGRAVEVVLVEALAAGTVWRQRIGSDGAEVDIHLADGRRLRSHTTDALLNRMLEPPAALLAQAVPGDALYARGELTSFAASWLQALAPRVVNPPTPQGLCGRWRSALGWRMLGRRAGLSVADFDLDSADPPPVSANGQPEEEATIVLTIGGEALDSRLPPSVRAGLGRLAALAQTPVLGVRFAGSDPARAGWRLLDANPYPDLSTAGDAGAAALAAELTT